MVVSPPSDQPDTFAIPLSVLSTLTIDPRFKGSSTLVEEPHTNFAFNLNWLLHQLTWRNCWVAEERIKFPGAASCVRTTRLSTAPSKLNAPEAPEDVRPPSVLERSAPTPPPTADRCSMTPDLGYIEGLAGAGFQGQLTPAVLLQLLLLVFILQLLIQLLLLVLVLRIFLRDPAPGPAPAAAETVFGAKAAPVPAPTLTNPATAPVAFPSTASAADPTAAATAPAAAAPAAAATDPAPSAPTTSATATAPGPGAAADFLTAAKAVEAGPSPPPGWLQCSFPDQMLFTSSTRLTLSWKGNSCSALPRGRGGRNRRVCYIRRLRRRRH